MTSRLLTSIACLALAVSVLPVQAQRATRERQVLISVLDKSDKIATGLPPTDFARHRRIADGNGHGIVLPDMGAYEFSERRSDQFVIPAP